MCIILNIPCYYRPLALGVVNLRGSHVGVLNFHMRAQLSTERQLAVQMQVAIMASSKKQALLPGYLANIDDKPSKERYLEKLRMLNGLDSYELPLREWQDDVDKWPEISFIDVTVDLLFSPSPFTQEKIKNYKSLECY